MSQGPCAGSAADANTDPDAASQTLHVRKALSLGIVLVVVHLHLLGFTVLGPILPVRPHITQTRPLVNTFALVWAIHPSLTAWCCRRWRSTSRFRLPRWASSQRRIQQACSERCSCGPSSRMPSAARRCSALLSLGSASASSSRCQHQTLFVVAFLSIERIRASSHPSAMSCAGNGHPAWLALLGVHSAACSQRRLRRCHPITTHWVIGFASRDVDTCARLPPTQGALLTVTTPSLQGRRRWLRPTSRTFPG